MLHIHVPSEADDVVKPQFLSQEGRERAIREGSVRHHRDAYVRRHHGGTHHEQVVFMVVTLLLAFRARDGLPLPRRRIHPCAVCIPSTTVHWSASSHSVQSKLTKISRRSPTTNQQPKTCSMDSLGFDSNRSTCVMAWRGATPLRHGQPLSDGAHPEAGGMQHPIDSIGQRGQALRMDLRRRRPRP